MKVDRVVASGEPIRFGDVTITPYRTPGHSPGCTTWTTQVSEGGKQYNVVFVCQLTVPHGESLTHNENYPQIAADFAITFERCAHCRAMCSSPNTARVSPRWKTSDGAATAVLS